MYMARIVAGILFLVGFLIMVYNLAKNNVLPEVLLTTNLPKHRLWFFAGSRNPVKETVHRWMERRAVRFSIWVFIALAIGGAVEIHSDDIH